jgi:hypothetical protein
MNDDPIAEALSQATRLQAGAVTAVFQRYGKPLAVDLPPRAADDESVTVDDGTLRVIEVRTPVDVIANHWFVLERAGSEPLAMPGPLFAAAMAALTRAGRP